MQCHSPRSRGQACRTKPTSDTSGYQRCGFDSASLAQTRQADRDRTHLPHLRMGPIRADPSPPLGAPSPVFVGVRVELAPAGHASLLTTRWADGPAAGGHLRVEALPDDASGIIPTTFPAIAWLIRGRVITWSGALSSIGASSGPLTCRSTPGVRGPNEGTRLAGGGWMRSHETVSHDHSATPTRGARELDNHFHSFPLKTPSIEAPHTRQEERTARNASG